MTQAISTKHWLDQHKRPCVGPSAAPHQMSMEWKAKFGRVRRNPLVRLGLFALGIIFLVITAIIGPLPGPGGIVTFAIGAGLILQNSVWARRRYVRLKKWQPRLGGWADWGLRRKSAKRRIEREKAKSDHMIGPVN